MIEQTMALLDRLRRLRIRWRIHDDIHEVFMALAIVCRRRLIH
ncbi:hypothetical protein [Streptosporangium sp. NPDC020145]